MKAIVHKDQAIEEWREGVRTRRSVAASDGTTGLCIFEQWVDPGTGAPTHIHSVEEVLTVISGEADVWVEQDHATVGPAASVIVPAGARHGFRNIGSSILHVQAVLASAEFEARYNSADAPVQRWSRTDG